MSHTNEGLAHTHTQKNMSEKPISRMQKKDFEHIKLPAKLWGNSAKETYNFKEPTNRSQPIADNFLCSNESNISSNDSNISSTESNINQVLLFMNE